MPDTNHARSQGGGADIVERLWNAEMKGNNSALLAEARREIERMRAHDAEAVLIMRRLEAEIERLRAYRDQAALAWTKLTDSQEAEIEQLKAEIERLTAVIRMAISEIEDDDESGACLTLKCSMEPR